MLPFLKNKERGLASVIISKRQPSGSIEEVSQEADDPSAAIESCASDLIKAIEAKDVKAVAAALQAAFEICDSQPHVEGPHTDKDSA